ncbi:PDT-domain-containing protein [Pluteus cervinus]|uniref:PDT-domain-containing protein n=1 Tax=Pluteus cervinus TaxID=181527 RepID=A0ACD3BGI5_9AGAR|nr:PDT-domain-containing protein [Pluteus cervinus]
MGDPATTKVSVLGPLGTYTHEAAFKYFGAAAEYHEERTVTDVFHAISHKSIPFGVVPQENSIYGSVIETYDLLRADGALVCGEIILEVQHCLLVRRGTRLDQIERVISHEQALGQCSDFIQKHLPKASLVKTTSTASAAQAVVENPPNCAAICSKICATLFDGLELLYEGIQNESTNFTRFYALAGELGVPPPAISYNPLNRALLRIRGQHTGQKLSSTCLVPVLSVLHLDISRIDRRPSLESEPFHNVYFLEIQSTEAKEGDKNWAETVNEAVGRVRDAGGLADIIGLW